MNDVATMLIHRANWWVYIILMLIGLYGITMKKNFMKKIIGLSILQTSIILLFVSIGAKYETTLPIIEHSHDAMQTVVQAAHYINPLPHVLMLTAIVVAVATLGVALALSIKIYREYNTLDEDEILLLLKEKQ